MTDTGFEHCPSFISSQCQSAVETGADAGIGIRRAVTISRQACSGAREIAEKLGAYLQKNSPEIFVPWVVFDRNLMEKVLEEHNLPAYLAKLLPEDRVSELEDFLVELFGVHPPSRTVVQQSVETILKLAELGNVILIGRGGNMITARLPHMLHVRLVAPLEERIGRAHKVYDMTPAQARAFCLNEDLGRERYLKKYFNANINNPLLYHMVINTSLMSHDEAAKLIGNAAMNLA